MKAEDFDACTDLNQVPRELQSAVRMRAIARRIAAMPSNVDRHEFLAKLAAHHSKDTVNEIRRIAWDMMKVRVT